MALAGGVVRPFPPEGGQRLRLAEGIGRQLQEGLCADAGPEFLAPLHPAVDLLDGRFDVAAGQRQPLAAVLVVRTC